MKKEINFGKDNGKKEKEFKLETCKFFYDFYIIIIINYLLEKNKNLIFVI